MRLIQLTWFTSKIYWMVPYNQRWWRRNNTINNNSQFYGCNYLLLSFRKSQRKILQKRIIQKQERFFVASSLRERSTSFFPQSQARRARSKIMLSIYYDIKEKQETARSLAGNQFYTKQDFLARSFSIPTLSTVKHSSIRSFILIFQSSPKIYKPYAHHKNHLQTMKVYNTRPVGLTCMQFGCRWAAKTLEPLTLSKIVAHALFKKIFSFRIVNTIQNGISVLSYKYSSITKNLGHVVYVKRTII